MVLISHECNLCSSSLEHTGWRTKCYTIDCTRNTFLLLQKHLTSGTELILIGSKIVPNEEHVQCDHCVASQPLANKPLHSSQLFDTSKSAQHNFTMWALSCTTFSHFLWNTFSFKNPHKKKSHGLISRLWGGHNLPPSWCSGNRCDIARRLNVSYGHFHLQSKRSVYLSMFSALL